MNFSNACGDTEYRDGIVKTVGRGGVTFEDGWGILVQNEIGDTRSPVPGDTLRLYGRGLGYTVRGIGLVDGGQLVGMYRYQTGEEHEADRQRKLKERKLKERKAWVEGLDAFAMRVRVLPQAFRERIALFSRRDTWGAEFGNHELFSCEEAVKIAKHVGASDKIQAFRDDSEAQKAAGISEDHSGNTFGSACALASAFLQDSALVPKMHGALCPLVGCQAYGCGRIL